MQSVPSYLEIKRLPRPEDIATPKPGKHSLKVAEISEFQQRVRGAAEHIGIEIVEVDKPEVSNSGSDRDTIDELRMLREVVPNLRVPDTLSWSTYQQMRMPGYVAKDPDVSHGRGKYLLEDPDQIARFERWVDESGQRDKVTERWIFQKYINTPTDRPTSFRVIVNCMGEIKAGELLYGALTDQRVVVSDRLAHERITPVCLLEDPSSPYYLNARGIASNRILSLGSVEIEQSHYDPKDGKWIDKIGYTDPKTGEKFKTDRTGPRVVQAYKKVGGAITLVQPSFGERVDPSNESLTDEERMIVGEHGDLDPDAKPGAIGLPRAIAQASSEIARKLCIEPSLTASPTIKNLWVGLDWVQDKKGRCYFLEGNRRPAMGPIQRGIAGNVSRKAAINLLIEDTMSSLERAISAYGRPLQYAQP